MRLPSFQVDREILDEHVLEQAVAEGAQLIRPAKVSSFEISGKADACWWWKSSRARKREITARWVVDASGRRR